MIASAPTKILIGIPSDPEDSKELLSWAIRVIAQPNDTIVALHIIECVQARENDPKKRKLRNKDQAKLRQAKAQVISLLGEFSWTCQSKQVNLEAKVGFSHRIGQGLIEEVKSLKPCYILLHGSRISSNRASQQIRRYCLEHAPVWCTLVSVGKCRQPQPNSSQDSLKPRVEDDKCGSMRSTKSKYSASQMQKHKTYKIIVEHSSVDSASQLQKHMTYETIVEEPSVDSVSPIQKRDTCETIEEKPPEDSNSPRTVLDELEGGSNSTEDDCFSTGDSAYSTVSESTQGRTNSKKQMFPTKLITSFFSSPLRKRKGSSRCTAKPQEQQQYHHQPLLKCFSNEEISDATDNFHPDNIIGRGGYSEVYKGYLSDGTTIAVKTLAKDHRDAKKEKEFLTELGVIGHVSHPNTADLLGCCIENGLYLIFKFSHNGNLESALHGRQSNPLSWPTRYKIALGVARGLHYLHKCCKRRIIHRDIKASNVLLGPDYEPQITDFGLAKWLPNKCTHHAVPIEGTFGYLAPEYFMNGVVDEKTDVFAFGVLLMEIITGRQPVDSSNQNLLIWAKPLMESGDISELADPNLDGSYDMDQLQRLVLTASFCIRQSAAWRPSMSEVLELLTNDQDSAEVAKTWSTPNFTSDELDDYSMVFGYEMPSDVSLDLEDFLRADIT